MLFAPPSHGGGHRFEPRTAHHIINDLGHFRVAFFIPVSVTIGVKMPHPVTVWVTLRGTSVGLGVGSEVGKMVRGEVGINQYHLVITPAAEFFQHLEWGSSHDMPACPGVP